MACASNGIVRTVTVAAVIGLAAAYARAQERSSSLGAYAGVQASYTDNLTLSPEDGQGARVGEVMTGITFDRVQRRIDAHVGYDLEALYYDDQTASNQVYHTLDARTDLTLVTDRVFLEVFGVYDQSLADATAVFTTNNLLLSPNRTDVAIVGVTPRISLDVGESVVGELSYSSSWVDYEDPLLLDAVERFTDFYMEDADDRRGVTWGVEYEKEQYDYGPQSEVEFETLTLELGYWVSPTVRLFTQQGLESDYNLVLSTTGESPGLDEHFWYAGVEWQPNERTNVVLAVGERSYGESKSLEASYELPRSELSLSYVEEPSSFVHDHISAARYTGELAPIDTLDGPAGNTFFLQERWEAAYVLDRQRSSVGLRFFDDRRFDIVDQVNGVTNETEHYGGRELWLEWELNVLWTMTASALAARRTSTLYTVDDNFTSYEVDFERQVGRAAIVSFLVARESSEPAGDTGGTNRYTANLISVGFQRGFGDIADSDAASRFSGFLYGGQRR